MADVFRLVATKEIRRYPIADRDQQHDADEQQPWPAGDQVLGKSLVARKWIRVQHDRSALRANARGGISRLSFSLVSLTC